MGDTDISVIPQREIVIPSTVFQSTQTNVVPLVGRGTVGQVSSLQEWQNSGGTAIASVGPGGNFISSSATPIVFQSVGSGTYTQTVIYNGAGGLLIDRARTTDAVGGTPINFDITTRGGTGTNAMLRYNSSYTLQVISAPAQTADLQQWQNSSGTVLASISSSGSIVGSFYAIPFFFGGPQGNAIKSPRYYVTRSCRLSEGRAAMAGGSGLSWSVYKNGALWYNATTSSAFGFTHPSSYTANSGDYIQVSQDAGTSIVDLSVTLGFVTA